jgi:Hydrazine synthase alpha subunit middle domain
VLFLYCKRYHNQARINGKAKKNYILLILLSFYKCMFIFFNITTENILKFDWKETFFGTFFRRLGKYILPILVAACSGGGGGGTTLTSNSQDEDPVVLEIPVAYIKRPLPEAPLDLREPLEFHPGARLFVRERSSASADEIDITQKILAVVATEEGVSSEQLAIDIKDIESSYDGGRLIFAARVVVLPIETNLEFSTWNLWTYEIETESVEYVIPSRIKRNEGMESGGGQDIAPIFLPDDRILFSSTRQVAGQARLLNEGRGQIFAALNERGDQPAAVLHIYDPKVRNSEFQQISFNLSHDLDPALRANGDIVFSRWNNATGDHISLYQISPTGLSLSPLYGFHSQNSGSDNSPIEYSLPRELDDGRLLALARPFASETLGGEIVIIDATNYSDHNQATVPGQGASGSGQTSLTSTEVRTDGLLSPGGQFASLYPLRDGTQRLLVSWSECRVIDESLENPEAIEEPGPGDYLPCTLQANNNNQAPPLYGAWVYDPSDNTQQAVVIAEEGFFLSEVIAAEPRDFPGLASLPPDYNADLAIQHKGQLLIDSVYDIDGADLSPRGIAQHAQPGTASFSERPARFLRVVHPVPIPDPDVLEIPRFASGVSGAFSFREIAGYVPIEPDGSVTVTLAANRPFSISIVDRNGRRIGRPHVYWLQLGPGEVLHCRGCHDSSSTAAHGRYGPQPASSNPGASALPQGSLGFPGTHTEALFATEIGQTMAQVWDFHRPLDNAAATDRELSLDQHYVDEWSATDLPVDPEIGMRRYDPAWTDIPPERSIIVDNLDPAEPARAVINYIDHIHPIWERIRTAVPGPAGVAVTACIGCHNSVGDTAVAAGQLDLGAEPSAIDADHYRSYRELLDTDMEQWLSTGDMLTNRTRVCDEIDADGNILTTSLTLPLGRRMQAGSANGSNRFFNCFEGRSCGAAPSPALPDNCTEDTGFPVPASRNTVDHNGMLSASELRLISEWLDIGAQYYNNPFDPRLGD